MSRASKIFLASSAVLCASTIWGVHFLQERESDNMYQGVLKDEARLREKALSLAQSASSALSSSIPSLPSLPSSSSSNSPSPLNTPSSPVQSRAIPASPVTQPEPTISPDCETCHISPPAKLLESASPEERARERAARAEEYAAQRGLADRLEREQGVGVGLGQGGAKSTAGSSRLV